MAAVTRPSGWGTPFNVLTNDYSGKTPYVPPDGPENVHDRGITVVRWGAHRFPVERFWRVIAFLSLGLFS